jgi:D-arabinose 1-dehydrogenase-like Zn-dependent alcohol dehydrogenase
MDTIKIVDEINQDRRRLFRTIAMAVAATQLGTIAPAAAQRVEAKMPAIKPGTHTSFGPLKQLDAGVLTVGYAEAGPARDAQDTLEFSWLSAVHPMIEQYPLGRVADAYAQMHSGRVRFRVVLTVDA